MKKIILDFAGYNEWANNVLCDWLKSLDSALLYKLIPSSFPSIDLTLQHLKNAQLFWYAVISEIDTNTSKEEILVNDIEQVMADLKQTSADILGLVTSFSDDQLAANVSSPAITSSRAEFILHLVNHNSYHRGQIITICRSYGITENIVNTDYDNYLWLKKNN